MKYWQCETRLKEGVIIYQRVLFGDECMAFHFCPSFDMDDYDFNAVSQYDSLFELLAARTATGKRLIHPMVEEQVYKSDTGAVL